jgi:hypothetical protein
VALYKNILIHNMERSTEINELAKALAKFKGSCPKIKQESTVKVALKTGGSYSFKYADLATIDEAVTPALSANGLSVTQLVGSPGELTTFLMHESGQFISTTSTMPVGNVSDKQVIGGVITYLRRYAIAAILGIVSDEDDDANYASGTGNTASKASKPAAAKQSEKKAVEPGEPEEKKPLTKDIKDKMIAAIKAGDWETVESRLSNYTVSLGDKTELSTLISTEKAKGNGSPVK